MSDAAAMTQSSHPQIAIGSARQTSLLVSALVIYVALVSASSLTKLPINDEAWYAQPAFRLAAGASMGTPAIENAGVRRFQGIQEHTYWIMPLFIVAQAGVYKLLGASLLQMRMLSAICGMALILSWRAILRALVRDRWIATLAAALLAIDFQMIAVCATGRSDAMCAALGSAGLAAFLTLRKRALGRAIFLSECLIVASGLTHPYGFYYFVGLLYLMIHFDRPSLTWRSLGVGSIPYVIGAALWGSYILKSPADFAAQFGNNASQRAWVVSHPAQAFVAELGRYRNAYGFSSGATPDRHLEIIVLLAYLVGAVGVVVTRSLRENPALRPLLILSGMFFLDLVFLEGAKQPWYLIHLTPCLAVLLAIFVTHSWATSFGTKKVLLAAGVIALAGLNVVTTVGISFRDAYHVHYARLIEILRQRTPEQAKVMGGAELGFALGFDNVRDDYKLGFYSGSKPPLIVIGESYRAQFDLFRLRRPEIWRYVQHRLNDEYVKAFDDGYYCVYALRVLSPEVAVDRLPRTLTVEMATRQGRN